jgi:SAM-dependent methyltransferase
VRSSWTPILDAARHIKHRFWPQPERPVNLRARYPATLEGGVDYAIQVATNFMAHFRRTGFLLAGSKILELGPGIDFGAQLIFASHGAQVAVADRFLAPWDSDYHPQFYRLLRSRWSGPAGALDAVIAASGYPEHAIRRIACSGEQLGHISSASFDLVLSNAVLEHVQDLQRIAINLGRVTKSPGLNLHQIDFRDHKDFSEPLEFLLLSNREQEVSFERMHGELGNRLRASEAISHFQAAGFVVDAIEKNGLVDENYLREFLPRLRQSRSAYRDWPAEDLRIIGALFTLRK